MQRIQEISDLPTLVPIADCSAFEDLKEFPKQQEVLTNDCVWRELEDGDVVRRVVKPCSNIQIVCVVQLPTVKCMDSLQVVMSELCHLYEGH